VKRILPIVLGTVIALSAAISPVAGKRPTVQGGRLDFQLPDLTGNMVSSADGRFDGKVLLVDLWATWCKPCITEIPTLIDLQETYEDTGLVIVAIAFEAEDGDEQRRSRLREFVKERGINYLVLDGGPPENFETALPSVKNVRGFPVEILVDRKGAVAVARNGYGYRKKWARKIRREIEALLKQPGKE
jgi:thiol-disulfide isomerase/thioredoxin